MYCDEKIRNHRNLGEAVYLIKRKTQNVAENWQLDKIVTDKWQLTRLTDIPKILYPSAHNDNTGKQTDWNTWAMHWG